MFGGDGSGARDIAESIDKLTEAIKRHPSVHFDSVAIGNLSRAVDQLRTSLEELKRSPLAALASSRMKQGAESLVKAFESMRDGMKGRP